MTANATAIADLYASHEEWKNGHSKALTIIGGVTAILSTMSSSLLVFIVARSRDRLRTTYHRLVLGMSVSDILFSACWMTFQAMSPTDMGYVIWNAGGNQATCDAAGFLTFAGMTASLFYSCSLNLNYLAVVKYSCSEAYIRSRIEPFLHFFPIGLALAFGIVPLAGNNFNGGGASCQLVPVYEPPHCEGIEDGQVREGFEIPCGRGRDGFPAFYFAAFFLDRFVPPVVVGVSLSLMYRALHNQEDRTARYGAGALNLRATWTTLSRSLSRSFRRRADSASANGENGGRARGDLWADGDAAAHEGGGGGARSGIGRTIASSVTLLRASLARRFGRRAPANPERPLSHAVMQRAAAYSFAFFLAWSWAVIAAIVLLALGGRPDPRPNWWIALWYMASIFQPLQGFFNLLIYMQPRVTSARRFRGRELSWRQAIARAFRTSLGLEWRGGDAPPAADAGRGRDTGEKRRRAPPVTEEETVEVVGPSDRESAGNAAEEEKVEIQGSDGE